ncbi:MAG TPA: TrpB-like pyridoxal phosphate-dependent enzyme [Candidatus Hydrogenedentes bacterium]|nr:TrpB-like pyridoxal phosphate-dependent enzyme [Candidatus Hydrogenedentota bacterium]
MEQYSFLLDPAKMPDAWYNINADLQPPLAPPLHPATFKPIVPEDMTPIFPMSLIEQEMSAQPMISIPGELMDLYRLWRPTPLRRAYRLEKALGTPAKIFYKNESVCPGGSHKINTAVAQAYYNKEAGIKEITTETGAGQWGSALSIACGMFGMKCTVYMVRVSYEQKPYRRTLMQTYGSSVIPSPSDTTQAGRSFLEHDPNTTGSLGMAISEAIEAAVTSGGKAKYALGSVLNHVLLHQTVIGQEAKLQMEMAGEYPDIVIGCCGGGSNLGGVSFPFMQDKLRKGTKVDFVAVEPASCPTLTRGLYAYDYGDTGKMTPLLLQYTLGHNFVPAGIHAGGLRYHGVAAQIAHLVKNGNMRAIAYHQNPVFEASLMFARAEGIVPAPESGHAIRAAVDEALKCKESGEKKSILFNLSGHGNFDMTAYENYISGKLVDHELEEDRLREAEAAIPKI